MTDAPSPATTVTPGCDTGLPAWRSVLAVVAHPDDESFGLGVLATFAASGASFAVLCFTHGEASTVHGVSRHLRAVRARELDTAARLQGASGVRLLDHPDGQMEAIDLQVLAAHVVEVADQGQADGWSRSTSPE